MLLKNIFKKYSSFSQDPSKEVVAAISGFDTSRRTYNRDCKETITTDNSAIIECHKQLENISKDYIKHITSELKAHEWPDASQYHFFRVGAALFDKVFTDGNSPTLSDPVILSPLNTETADKFTDEITRSRMDLPAYASFLTAIKGTETHIGRRLIDFEPATVKSSISGYEGRTLDYCPAFYETGGGKTRIVMLQEHRCQSSKDGKYIVSENPYFGYLHEVGHVIARLPDFLSRADESSLFADAYKKDVASLSALQGDNANSSRLRKKMSYFLSISQGGNHGWLQDARNEVWAEGFAIRISGLERTQEFRTTFKESMKAQKTILAAIDAAISLPVNLKSSLKKSALNKTALSFSLPTPIRGGYF